MTNLIASQLRLAFRHFALLKNGVEKNLSRIDDRLFRGECVDRAVK